MLVDGHPFGPERSPDQGDGTVGEGNERIGEVSPLKLESEGLV